MAQIIKHRRGSIASVKGSTSRKGELIIATGSINDLQGPFVFIGNDDGQGLYNSVSKIYAGASAPTLSNLTYGSVLDGTPFYSTDEHSLYILNNTGNGGNTKIDLSGNLEGNTISGVTINNLESTNVTASFVSASFVGDGGGLYGIPATGITGLNLSKIYSGSVQVSTDSVSETITLSGGTINLENNTYINNSTLYVSEISGDNGAYVNIFSSDYAQLSSNNSYIFVNNLGAHLQNDDSALSGVTARNNGQVEVTGSLSVGGGNFIVDGSTGDIRTSGSITMKGNITIGDNMTGDTINLNAEISSSLIPSGTLLFDLGSTTNKWNNLYVGTVNADNINLGSVSFSGLTQDRVVFVGESGSLVDNSGFTFTFDGGPGDNVLTAPIIRASNDGNGTNFLIGNDMWLGDINEGNATRFMGNEDNAIAKIYLGNNSTNNYLEANYNDVTLKANNNLNLISQNNHVYLESYDGTVYINDNSGNNTRIGGQTYMNNNLHGSMKNSEGTNYI